ncbi:MAG: hypothetical protein NZ872_02255 [Archaeoglobaceae archaeon]|nr:hypothetical protein [Archaeoglobaceae archaeon]MDW8128021.1 hypothetical protein [Archaeoglobaceae archaeon]
MKNFKIILLLVVLLSACVEKQKMEEQKEIYDRCLEELKNEKDPSLKFLGVEKQQFDEKLIEVCCAKVTGENGTVKYCFEPVISKLSPVYYRNIVFWKLEGEREIKVLEGYEKDNKFWWKSYDEEGKLTGVVEYYMGKEDLCAKIFDSKGVLIGDTCK